MVKRPRVHDWDEPLFDMPTKPRKAADSKVRVTRAYKGKPVTCHVCIISVARGLPRKEERLPSSVQITEPDGRVWMLCGKHANQVRDGILSLPFNPRERDR